MEPKTNLSRVIYFGIVPIVAALVGGVGGALIQAQACNVVGASELQALLQDAQMNGAQKLEFMKTYLELTDRPWSVVRSIVSFATIIGMASLGLYAGRGGFRSQ